MLSSRNIWLFILLMVASGVQYDSTEVYAEPSSVEANRVVELAFIAQEEHADPFSST